MDVYRQDRLRGGDRLRIDAEEERTVYRLENETGTGTVTEYALFGGVSLLFDDMRMRSFSEGAGEKCALVVEYCLEGRFEAGFCDGRQFYLGPGDICLHNMDYGELGDSSMPLRRYRGITAMVKTDGDALFAAFLSAFGIDFADIERRTREAGGVIVLRESERIRRVFGEMYRVSGENRKGYFRLKLLESLLFLNGISFAEDRSKGHTLPKETSDILKRAERYLWEHLSEPLTIGRLAEFSGMSQSSFKSHFRVLFGCPVHTYLNACRMQVAACKLVRTDEKISDIARQVGFKSEHKFSKAFAAFSGSLPRAYRRAAILPDWAESLPVRV